MMLCPTKKDVEYETDQGTTADPLSFILPKNTDHQWEKNNSRENQIDNKNEIPGKSMFKERRKDHRPIRGQEIEDDVTDQNQKADFIKTPKGGALRYSYKEPTEKKGVKGGQ